MALSKLFDIFPATKERKVLGRENSVMLGNKILLQQEGKPDLEVYEMPAKGLEFIDAFHTPENVCQCTVQRMNTLTKKGRESERKAGSEAEGLDYAAHQDIRYRHPAERN